MRSLTSCRRSTHHWCAENSEKLRKIQRSCVKLICRIPWRHICVPDVSEIHSSICISNDIFQFFLFSSMFYGFLFQHVEERTAQILPCELQRRAPSFNVSHSLFLRMHVHRARCITALQQGESCKLQHRTFPCMSCMSCIVVKVLQVALPASSMPVSPAWHLSHHVCDSRIHSCSNRFMKA